MLEIIRMAFNGLPVQYALLLALAFLIAILTAITIHEYAHGYVAYKCGDTTAKYNGRLSLNPARHFDPLGFLLLVVVGFGWAKPVPVDSSNFVKPYKSSMVKISLAGVVMNFILFFVFYPLFLVVVKFMPVTPEWVGYIEFFLSYLLQYLFTINLTLAVFNLIPVYPLDGFNLLDTLSSPYNRYVQFCKRYGMFALIGLFVLLNIDLPVIGNLFGLLIDTIAWPFQALWNTIFGIGLPLPPIIL